MKIIKYITAGVLSSLLLVSGAYAFSIGPKEGTNAYQFQTYSMSFGVDDDTGVDYKGSITAAGIGLQLGNYGNSQWGSGKTSNGGNLDLYPDIFGGMISLFNSYLPNTFTEVETFIFYLNGHGLKTSSNNEPNAIFTASDGLHNNYGLTDIKLQEYLSILPRTMNKIVILDSCYSGGFIDELKKVNNISILTSASSTSKSFYGSDGISMFSRELYQFLDEQGGRGFEFFDMVNYIKFNFYFNKYRGMKAYELGAGDPVELSEEYFNIQTYQSPTYQPVPEPSTFILLGGGLIGLSFAVRRRRKE